MISAQAPVGGIVAELGGKSRPLLLRNGEIERFEEQHGVGIFGVLDSLIGRGPYPHARHVRDLVALGLVGGGMPDRAADDIVSALPPAENIALRSIAMQLVTAAFIDPVKKNDGDGSDERSETETHGTFPSESEEQSGPVSSPEKSEK